MIETPATVVRSASGRAWVETLRQSACGHCQSASSCGTSVLAEWTAPRRTRVLIDDPEGLSAGEQVTIGIPDGTLVRASLIAYLTPLIALIGGAGIATALDAPEWLVASVGIVGLGVGLWVARRLTGRQSARARYRPVLIGRVGAAATDVPVPVPVHRTSD